MTANKHYVCLRYSVDGESFDDAFIIEHDGRFIEGGWADSAAEKCAEDFFDNHDGWERSDWRDGVKFTLWRDDRTLIGTFSVVMEMQPSFTAYEEDAQ